MAENQTRLKVVLTGDVNVGKTTFTLRYIHERFAEEYLPNIVDNFIASKEVNGHQYIIEIVDTPGADDYDRLRPPSYADTNVFLILFSVVKPEAFDRVQSKWKIEINQYCPNIPIVLVGTKADLRTNPDVIQTLEKKGQKPVTHEQANAMAKAIGAVTYMETSSLTGTNVNEVFDLVIKSASKHREDSKGHCVIS